jgi:hypothetical protein
MNPSIQLSLGPALLQRVSGGTVERRKVQPLALALKALGRAGISSKAASIDMGVSPSLFSRQFSDTGREHASLRRMAGLPGEFWEEFAVLILQALGKRAILMDEEQYQAHLSMAAAISAAARHNVRAEEERAA